MKTVLALLAAALAAVSLAPSAQAEAAAPPEAPRCVTVYDFPDLGWRVCVDPEDRECTVYEERTTIVGTERDCIYPDREGSVAAARPSFPACVPVAVGRLCFSPYWPGCNLWVEWTAIPAPPTCLHRTDDPSTVAAGPECMDVYSRTDVGTYSVVRRDSCAPPELYECPYEGAPTSQCRDLLRLEAASTVAGCYMVYTRTDVGTISVVRRTSCSAPEAYRCPYEGAPIERCEPLLGLRPATASAGPGGECLQVYRETTVGPVTQVSRDSCHSEVYVCDADRSRGDGDTLRGYVAGQLADPDAEAAAGCVAGSTGLLGAA